MNGIHVAAQGRLPADAEMRFTSTGKQLVTFSLAVTENRPAGDGADTAWLRVTVWEDLAEQLATVLKKGTEVYIEGKLKLDQWTGQDGQQRSGLKVSAWKVELLGAIGHRAPKRERPEGDAADVWFGVPKTAEAKARW